MTPEEVALQREFGTQYLADEMPVFTDPFVRGVLPRWARSSASSLAVGHADAMLLLLERLRARPDEPFVEALSKASGMEWSEDWEIFQALLAHIARGIEALRRNEALGMVFNVFRQTEGVQHHYVLADEETGATPNLHVSARSTDVIGRRGECRLDQPVAQPLVVALCSARRIRPRALAGDAPRAESQNHTPHESSP